MAESDQQADSIEDEVYFIGPCTREHDMDEHGWYWCNVENCPCEAHWEE